MTDRIPVLRKIAYAAPAFALAVVGIPVYVYLPKFYTDVVGVHITALGYILLAVRLFDAVTDPALGLLSDRTDTRYGRRRPYIFGGALLLAGSIFFLFNPPMMGRTAETVWFTVGIFSLFLFWTVVTVPYESLGPEITFNYHERTTLFGMRDGALIAGTLAAASAPALIDAVLGLPDTGAGERTAFFWMSALYGPLVVLSCLWCCAAVRETPRAGDREWSGLLSDYRQVFRNRPFVILLAAYTVSAVGSNLPATLILYYVEYVLESDKADLFLLVYFVTGVVFMPGWIWLSGRADKKRAWLTAIAVNTGAFIGVFFLGPGDTSMYGVLVFLSGVGLGGTLALPSSIQADVIDYDELRWGHRREGRYIGLWSISKKLAAALGVGVGLSVLGVSGYEPNIPQPEGVRFTLRVLYALVPSLFNLVAFFIALAYPIDGDLHQQIRAGVEARNRGEAVEDPLTPGRRIGAE
jgi:GPH family glycoside/pentoside/hexuronide:cation symporter